MLISLLEQKLQAAAAKVLPDAPLEEIVLRPCPDPKFGDYQTNSLMGLAKKRKLNPSQLAADVLKHLQVSEWCETVEIAGAGFINFRLSRRAVVEELRTALEGKHLFFASADHPRRVVIDFSSPNVAKPMHVGHIRSTILGDCLARVFRLLGHEVITDNHIGDWGTQFGKLLVGWKEQLDTAALQADPLSEMERLYRLINHQCETETAILDRAREELVKLQSGDEENRRIWEEMISLSRKQFDEIYGRLDVKFDHTLGESFYNNRLKGIVEELFASGLARQSEGAVVVYFDDVPALKAHPAMIQKSDGGFNYTTTDLATLAYREEQWKPDEIIYVTDGRQQLHFQQLFEIYRRWHPDSKMKLRHVWFGKILGEDGKAFKTRTGGTIRLADLLDEAEERALKVVAEKNPDLGEGERKAIARVIGIGAVKYADLLPNRQSDYQFSWDKMLSLNGNTAPYLLYAHTRIQSIFRKIENADESRKLDFAWEETSALMKTPQEFGLAKRLLNFGFVIRTVTEECRPNYLCNYLYDLAGDFAGFYETCPVLKSTGVTRQLRLALCELTGAVMKKGLHLLGIETPEKM